jgi:hypothetical protein
MMDSTKEKEEQQNEDVLTWTNVSKPPPKKKNKLTPSRPHLSPDLVESILEHLVDSKEIQQFGAIVKQTDDEKQPLVSFAVARSFNSIICGFVRARDYESKFSKIFMEIDDEFICLKHQYIWLDKGISGWKNNAVVATIALFHETFEDEIVLMPDVRMEEYIEYCRERSYPSGMDMNGILEYIKYCHERDYVGDEQGRREEYMQYCHEHAYDGSEPYDTEPMDPLSEYDDFDYADVLQPMDPLSECDNFDYIDVLPSRPW